MFARMYDNCKGERRGRWHGSFSGWRTLRGVYIGIGIFAVLAVLCVVAFFVSQKRRRDYERGE
jgi:hypothetical protein